MLRRPVSCFVFPRKRNGSTLAEPGVPGITANSQTAPKSRKEHLERLHGMTTIPTTKPNPLGKRNPTPGVCTTCTAMCGSGLQQPLATPACSVAAVGSTSRTAALAATGTGTTRATGTSTSDSASSPRQDEEVVPACGRNRKRKPRPTSLPFSTPRFVGRGDWGLPQVSLAKRGKEPEEGQQALLRQSSREKA